jgi:glycine cleavage system regulatory protein
MFHFICAIQIEDGTNKKDDAHLDPMIFEMVSNDRMGCLDKHTAALIRENSSEIETITEVETLFGKQQNVFHN